MLSVPSEASAFLGLVAVCMTCLFVFYLYLTKKFCFNAIGGFPCCDEPLRIPKDRVTKELVNAFSYDDELESSSDSEDQLIERLQRSASNHTNLTQQSSLSKRESFDRNADKRHKKLRNGHKNVIETIDESTQRTDFSDRPLVDIETRERKTEKKSNNSRDLISLAEKGRIGKSGSSDGSSSSEVGSGDNDEDRNSRSSNSFAKEQTKLDKKSARNVSHPISFVDDIKCQYNNTAFESDAQSSTSHDLSQPFSQQSETTHSIPKCGSLEVSYAYDAPTKKLMITVFEAVDIPCKERGGANQIHVRVVLLPHKRHKHKTKIKSNGNPVFNESFTISRISPEEVMNLGLRFRVYGTAFARREQMIGESIILFACSKPQQQETRLWLTLEPRSNLTLSDNRSEVSSLARSDSTGSTQSMPNASLPEMLLGLAYNGTTGRLNVSVIKGSQFRSATMSRAPDTYVKLALVSSSGQEIARSKTSVRRGQPNPLFKETFIFQIALFQLPDVTMMISVYNKRSMKRKEMIGWFSLGYNSSGDEELSHWNDMRDSKGEQVCRWHVLLES